MVTAVSVLEQEMAGSTEDVSCGGGGRLATFMGVELLVNTEVLAPREETELLGRAAIDLLRERGGDQVVIDMCCGCGNLGLAVASQIPSARVWSSDLTDGTIDIARANVERLGLSGRVSVVQGDLFSGLAEPGRAGTVDLVICNPPYISTTRLEGDRAHLLESEPREAFDGGPYGISIMQRLVSEALPFLKDGGWLAFEFGAGQERQAALLLKRKRSYSQIQFRSDDDGVPRVALAQKQGPLE
jgi:release factor glutamine methyltransferase